MVFANDRKGETILRLAINIMVCAQIVPLRKPKKKKSGDIKTSWKEEYSYTCVEPKKGLDVSPSHCKMP